ncbi:excinuclease ABC subunit C [Oleiphilus sp. HI0009]|uniref:excinuclease ABC subunit UvrC n=1 Tax=Oleiphilus sp. HI0125 TaxID=1822266 RepID=UPI0007C3B16B|nr:excinuclease ABC subunit C [Oleiphilus sp. HI0009]KZZ60789.1 excinuclease ABC subunit C [Oleiphilus sp. HI0125]
MPQSSQSAIAQPFDAKNFLKNLSTAPGVYRMFDGAGQILYVGKAKNLKKRVSSYFLKNDHAPKTRALVSKIQNIEVTITNSETEALILEQNLIKKLKPPYNILLRDDKSYPYIYLATDKEFPSLSLKRVRTKGKVGQYFGPFPNAHAVRESLGLLEKIFKVRQCQESFYKNRSRPCLQYQIKRCKAPCVGLVDKDEYLQDVHHVTMFLQGKNPELLRQLIDEMETASEDLRFEKAAELRDQIQHLRHAQESQSVESGSADLDVVALSDGPGVSVFSMLFVRKGRILGHKNYTPKMLLDESKEERLQSFIEQYYVGSGAEKDLPCEVILPFKCADETMMSEAVQNVVGKNIRFAHKVKTIRAQWQKLAQTNADSALKTYLSNKENVFHRVDALRALLELPDMPKRMECFDISHSSGEKTVASCVVFNDQGPLKSDYRTFNIEGIEPGDDYAAMKQALSRRYRKVNEEPSKRPDIIFIDGGKGQLNMAIDVLNELNASDILLLGIAKGATRKPGFETLFIPDGQGGLKTIQCASDEPSLHLMQHIRDEAHRFAITGHRKRRDKSRRQSQLEGIDGVGPTRRRSLIKYFGSVQGIKTASIEEIAKVDGISSSLAEHIYLSLHGD